MIKAKQIADKDFIIDKIDDRIYGTFVEHIRTIVYGCLYNPKHEKADEQGFRTDIMELLKELKTTFIRYPGGNFVSGYHWKDGVGPKEERPRRYDLAWFQEESNQMGIDEFYDYSKKLGVDFMLAANMGTGTAEEAAEEVEYCNYNGNTTMANWRRENGHQEPYNIKMWCVGNEMDGPWQIQHMTAEEYGRKAMEASRMMKWMDPSIELVICGSSSPEPGAPEYPDWNRIVLEHTYDKADYISLHRYFCYDPKLPTQFNCQDTLEDIAHFPTDLSDFIDTVMGASRFVQGKLRTNKKVTVCFDEWGVVSSKNVHPIQDDTWTEKYEEERTNTVLDAMIYGSVLITFLNKCDVVKLACQSIVIGSMIKADPDGECLRQTTFYPFKDVATYGHGVTLRSVVDSPAVTTKAYGEEPALRSATVYNEETGEVTVFTVNLSLYDEIAYEADIRGFSGLTCIEHIQLYDEQPLAGNTFANPTRVQPKNIAVTPEQRTFALPRLSWNVLRFKVK
jgi:alpha-N-arabinofuranosidase